MSISRGNESKHADDISEEARLGVLWKCHGSYLYVSIRIYLSVYIYQYISIFLPNFTDRSIRDYSSEGIHVTHSMR